nr:zinc-finger domain-containing protein [Polymorphobacter sp.]
MATIPPPETFVTNAARVFCDGDETGVDGHPRVWLQIGAEGFADCGYCDRRFVLANGPADRR